MSVSSSSSSSISSAPTSASAINHHADTLLAKTRCNVRRFIKDDVNMSPSQADFSAAWLSYVLCLSIAHPMDTMRTRWQTLGRSPLTTLRGDKFLSLYAGVTTPIFAQGPLVAAVFCANEYARYVMLAQCGGKSIEDLSLLQLSLAGGVAGLGISVIQCPLTVVRLQQQNAHIVFKRPLPVKEVVTSMIRAEGVTGMWRSWWLEGLSNGVGRMAYFTTYEANKRLLVKLKAEREGADRSLTTDDLSPLERFAAGYGTSIISWFSIYPYDIVKNKLQADRIPGMTLPSSSSCSTAEPQLTTRYYTGWRHCMKETYKKEGLRGFFKGYGLTVFRSGLLTGTSLPLYEWLRINLRGSSYENQGRIASTGDDNKHPTILQLTSHLEEEPGVLQDVNT